MTSHTDTVRPEVTWLLARHGYGFSTAVRSRHDAPGASAAPALPVRLAGRQGVLLGGPEGVRVFTDTDRFRRHGAAPPPVSDVIFGRGGVQGLDGESHRRRKSFFVESLDVERVQDLVRRVGSGWEQAVMVTRDGQDVDVVRASARLIGVQTLAWAGVDLDALEGRAVSDRLETIVGGFGVLGPDYLRARRARRRSDAWAERLVREVRTGRRRAPDASPLALAAAWTDDDGSPLPAHVAGVELQNLVRPAVAASRFVGFAALQLLRRPEWRRALADEHAAGRARLGAGERGRLATAFAREVRRHSPFVPLLAARSRRDQECLGVPLAADAPALLDVVGTLRDPAVWPAPRHFSPERFLDGQVTADALVPQGGGSVMRGHRCPGEDPVLGILACSSTALALVLDGRPTDRGHRVDERRVPGRVTPAVFRLRSSTTADRTRARRA